MLHHIFFVNLLTLPVDKKTVVCSRRGDVMLKEKNNKADVIKEVNFNGAVVIDEQGREVAIADEMIESVFECVKDSIGKPYQQ